MRDVAGLYLLDCDDGYPLHGIMWRSPVDERTARPALIPLPVGGDESAPESDVPVADEVMCGRSGLGQSKVPDDLHRNPGVSRRSSLGYQVHQAPWPFLPRTQVDPELLWRIL
jgi:hypothetical protein